MKTADRLRVAIGSNIADSIAIRPHGLPEPAGNGPPTNRYAGLDRIKGAVLIPLDQLEADPDQPRREFEPEALQQLAGSLTEKGQLQPARVRWVDGKWILLAGERRWRAAKLAGLTHLACVEETRELSPEDRIDLQLTENCLRDDLKPIEQANAFERLMNHRGWNQKQLAEHLHLSPNTVCRAIALLGLPVMTQEEIDAGVIPVHVGVQMAREPDPEVREQMREAVKASRPAKPPKIVYHVPGFRITLQPEREGMGMEEITGALQAALRKARGRGAA